jgi:TonB family protein
MKHSAKIFTLFLLSAVCLFQVNAQTKRKSGIKKTPAKPTSAIKVVKVGETEPKPNALTSGKALSLPKPIYTEEARKLKLAGSVNVEVFIDESGNIISAKAVSGTENLSLRKAAEDAARQAKFSPTLLYGKPVKVKGTIIYNFVPKAEPKKYNEETKFLGLGVFLSLLHHSATNPVLFNDLFDFEDFKTEFPVEFGIFPESIAKDLEMMADIKKSTDKERLGTIDKVMSLIEPKMSESEQWQFRLGKDCGDLFGLFSDAVGADGFDPNAFDESAAKLIILNIKDSIKTNPTGFSPNILQKFNAFLAESNKLDTKKPEAYIAFIDKLGSFFEMLDPSLIK